MPGNKFERIIPPPSTPKEDRLVYPSARFSDAYEYAIIRKYQKLTDPRRIEALKLLLIRMGAAQDEIYTLETSQELQDRFWIEMRKKQILERGLELGLKVKSEKRGPFTIKEFTATGQVIVEESRIPYAPDTLSIIEEDEAPLEPQPETSFINLEILGKDKHFLHLVAGKILKKRFSLYARAVNRAIVASWEHGGGLEREKAMTPLLPWKYREVKAMLAEKGSIKEIEELCSTSKDPLLKIAFPTTAELQNLGQEHMNHIAQQNRVNNPKNEDDRVEKMIFDLGRSLTSKLQERERRLEDDPEFRTRFVREYIRRLSEIIISENSAETNLREELKSLTSIEQVEKFCISRKIKLPETKRFQSLREDLLKEMTEEKTNENEAGNETVN